MKFFLRRKETNLKNQGLEGRKRARLAFENTVTLEWNGCGKHLYSESEVKTLLE
jgi:hypothetical protein